MKDRPSKEQLPANSKSMEISVAVSKGAVSAIPLVGGAISEFIATAVGLPLSKRRDEWFEDLESRLRELEQQIGGFSLKTLGDNEQFVSAAAQATQAAMRTHQNEKIEALRNAVLNTAIENGGDSDRQSILISLIDRLTPAHLRLLEHLRHPSFTGSHPEFLSWTLDKLKDANKRWEDLPRWVRDHVPGSKDYSQQFIKLLFSDIYSAGLTDIHPDSRPKPQDLPGGKTTEIGDQFLDFITSPLNRRP